MKKKLFYEKVPLLVGISFLLLLTLAEYSAILIMNNGLLTYTLDDPYIHLALAENILKSGHYGININEYSAPSSSILWPFLLAPFSWSKYGPLFVNMLAAIAIVVTFSRILNKIFRTVDTRRSAFMISVAMLLLISTTHITGLAFMGLEHTLQLLLVVMIVYGMIVEAEDNNVSPALLGAIIIAPLIRYENLSISCAALFYLLMRGYFRQTVITAFFLVLFVVAFSLFLSHLGLDPRPSSIVARSAVVANTGRLFSVIANIKSSLTERQGVFLCLGSLFFLSFFLFAQDARKKRLAAASLVAVILHVVAGKWGLRYEVYIFSFVILIILYLSSSWLKNIVMDRNISAISATFVGACMAFMFATYYGYIYSLFVTPAAAHNIYAQQYQMHRFAVDYYGKPVAINDLGYVSWKNNQYVLDLYGLASLRALHLRQTASNSDWMKELCNEYDVGLVMIYDSWFHSIPAEWKKLGDLHLLAKTIKFMGKEVTYRANNIDSVVTFYATDEKYYADIKKRLQDFVKTLPPEAQFEFANDRQEVLPSVVPPSGVLSPNVHSL